MELTSGVLVFISFIFTIVNIFTSSYSEENTVVRAHSNIDYGLIVQLIVLAVVVVCLAITGAVLSIIRAVKARKDRTPPKRQNIMTHISVITSSVIFFAFSVLLILNFTVFS